MHTECSSQFGASRWPVVVGVALMSGVAIAAWLWITPQRVASDSASHIALPPISIPTERTRQAAEGRKGMDGSSASEDIERRVQSLADASRRKSPDVSRFPAADTDNNAWPAVQAEAQVPTVDPRQQASTPEARAGEVEPERRQDAQETVQPAAQEETAMPGAEIDKLLAEARANLARDRLTTPSGANAFERFQAVLARDPTNAEATNGLQAIVARYVALARRVAHDGHFEKAESFLQRAERIGVGTDTLLAARQQLAEMRANR